MADVTVTYQKTGPWSIVSVRDQGTGMAPETLERLFEPFVQDETGLGHTHGGLGLGLAFARATVQAHGGEIYAGESSTLEVTLDIYA